LTVDSYSITAVSDNNSYCVTLIFVTEYSGANCDMYPTQN